MNLKNIVAILLIVGGIVVLGYSGISYKTRGKPVEVIGMKFETTEKHFIPPTLGAFALVGGIILLVANKKKD